MHTLGDERLIVGRIWTSSVIVSAGVAGAVALSVVVGGGAFASTQHKKNPMVNHKSTAIVIATVNNASLGTILVGQKKTVYTLRPTKVSCTALCISVWPEVTLPKGVTHATAG